MPLQIVRNDITKMNVDAIVNATNSSLLGGGGVDGAIHEAAGKGLLRECERLGGCSVGEAKITKGYRLPCKYVIHTVGPTWQGGNFGEQKRLICCYKNALALAKKHKCKSLAFPLISSGVFGYPKDLALRVAIDTIGDFLFENEMSVYIVVYDRDAYRISENLFSDIEEYIDDNYVESHTDWEAVRLRISEDSVADYQLSRPAPAPKQSSRRIADSPRPMPNLDDILDNLDESFSQMLLRKIDEAGMTDAQCYKKANIDRKLFSKIRSDVHYKPSKQTALAFAIALELSLDETKDLLMRAGYALSRSSKFDIIVEYFIQIGNYNVFEINEALFAFEQGLIGS